MKKKQKYWIEFQYTREDVGDMIKKLRTEHLNLTTEKMAEALEIKESLFVQYEQGNMNPNFAILRKIADIYKLDVTVKLSQKQ